MDPKKEAIPFIKSNQLTYRIEWINKGRVSPDFKFYIYGRSNYGKQVGIYDREDTIVRLEKYDQTIGGVTPQAVCAVSYAAESSYSNFKRGRGICVKVDDLVALEERNEVV